MAVVQHDGMPHINGSGKVDVARRQLRWRAERHWDVVAFLRHFQAFFPLSTVLVTAGTLLLCLGACWGVTRLLQAHPYLLVMALGLVCLVAGLAADPSGLLIHFSDQAQQLLLKKTVFDFVIDDAGMQNQARRWVRMLLLCYTTDSDNIATILEGMDPRFLDTVFRKRFIEYLPHPVSRVLLPEHLEGIPLDSSSVVSETRPTRPPEKHKKCVSSWQNASCAIEVASRLRRTARPDAEVEAIHHSYVKRLVVEKKEDINARVFEPSLAPVIQASFDRYRKELLRSLVPGRIFFVQVAQAAAGTVAAYWWGAAAMMARFPMAQSLLLQGFSIVGMRRCRNGSDSFRRFSIAAALLGAMSAGFTVALRAYDRRLRLRMLET